MGGRRALLVGGHRPVWFFAERDHLRGHPMVIDDDDRDDVLLAADPSVAVILNTGGSSMAVIPVQDDEADPRKRMSIIN